MSSGDQNNASKLSAGNGSTFTNMFQGVRSYLTPVLSTTTPFSERQDGVLTPDEFVAAGDALVSMAPTWSWQAGDPAKAKVYLPKDKQFLVTRRVPSKMRVASLEREAMNDNEQEIDGGGVSDGDDTWLATHTNHKSGAGNDDGADEEDEIEEIGTESGNNSAGKSSKDGKSKSSGSVNLLGALVQDHFGLEDAAAVKSDGGSKPPAAPKSIEEDDDDDYGDIQDDDDEALLVVREEDEDDGGENALMKTRSYDVSITYDKYYQTPRVWLFGYNEDGQPLTPDEVLEDVYQDYANRTVTMEPHPYGGTSGDSDGRSNNSSLLHASIHPCQHAAVMKRIVQQLILNENDASKSGGTQVEEYMFIFLKFIQSVIPTINYDHTMSVET